MGHACRPQGAPQEEQHLTHTTHVQDIANVIIFTRYRQRKHACPQRNYVCTVSSS